MSLEIIARKMHIFTEKGIGISLHTFLPFDEISLILRLLGLNSVLKPIFLPQMQSHCCICKTYHEMKLLSSAGKVEHRFFRFVLASKFSFFLSFLFFNEMNGSKQGAKRTCHYKKKSGGGK